MAFGTGTSIAHRALDGIFGPRTVQVERVEAAQPTPAATVGDACGLHSKAFGDVCFSPSDSVRNRN